MNTLTHPRQHPFASLYYESIALSKCEPWLINLHHQAVDKDSLEQKSAVRILEIVKTIIDALLPEGVRIHGIAASPTGVQSAASGVTILQLSDLSDGYPSFLALVMDILRQLADVFGERLGSLTEDVPMDGPPSPNLTMGKRIIAEGVVLIDEVDAHLHPSWQRTIGFMLQKVFPNIQLIVSTHSPFIAQAASQRGFFVLRSTPMSEFDTRHSTHRVRTWVACRGHSHE